MRCKREKYNAWRRAYHKTKKGFMVMMFTNMRIRVKGRTSRPRASQEGQPLMSRQSFYDWITANPDFHELFKDWEESNYCNKITPSIDRIDPRFGYEEWNIQIVTRGENSTRNNAFQFHNKII